MSTARITQTRALLLHLVDLGLLQRPIRNNAPPNPPIIDSNGCIPHPSKPIEPTAQDVLKKAPFSPGNTGLFSPQVYSNAPIMMPSTATPLNSFQLKSQLSGTLTKRLGGDFYTACQTISLMDDPKLKQIIPDSRIRAGLLSLTGTAGQAAIDAIRNGTFKDVTFGTPTASGAIAQVIPASGGNDKPSIVIDSKYQNEDFRLFGVALSHEALHSDGQNGAKEELINNVVDTTVYGQVLLINPEIARSETELSRRLNTKLMARINSRDSDGNLRLTTAQGNVYPGGKELSNFAAAYITDGTADTPGNKAMRKEVEAITGVRAGKLDFNDATIALLDKNQKALSPSQIVRLAKTLELT